MVRFGEVKEVQIGRVLRALKKEGVHVRGARIHVDGSVELLAYSDGPLDGGLADWVDLAGGAGAAGDPTRH